MSLVARGSSDCEKIQIVVWDLIGSGAVGTTGAAITQLRRRKGWVSADSMMGPRKGIPSVLDNVTKLKKTESSAGG